MAFSYNANWNNAYNFENFPSNGGTLQDDNGSYNSTSNSGVSQVSMADTRTGNGGTGNWYWSTKPPGWVDFDMYRLSLMFVYNMDTGIENETFFEFSDGNFDGIDVSASNGTIVLDAYGLNGNSDYVEIVNGVGTSGGPLAVAFNYVPGESLEYKYTDNVNDTYSYTFTSNTSQSTFDITNRQWSWNQLRIGGSQALDNLVMNWTTDALDIPDFKFYNYKNAVFNNPPSISSISVSQI